MPTYHPALFLCTYSQVNLTIVYRSVGTVVSLSQDSGYAPSYFRCVSPTMATVFQVYRSIAQAKLLAVADLGKMEINHPVYYHLFFLYYRLLLQHHLLSAAALC